MSEARPLQIAIADGSPAFLTAAANYVAHLPGFVLAGTANTALQALTLVSSAGPDVLLLDLGRSPVRGLEMVKQVKAAPGAPGGRRHDAVPHPGSRGRREQRRRGRAGRQGKLRQGPEPGASPALSLAFSLVVAANTVISFSA